MLDERYLTLAAFIRGCDVATEGRLLSGFNDWIAARYLGIPWSSLAWESLVAARRLPEILDGTSSIRTMTTEQEGQIGDDLLDLLDKFLLNGNPS